MLVLTSGSIMAFAFLAGSWAFTSYYLRYVFPGLFAVVAVFLFFRIWHGSPHGRARVGGITVLRASVFLLFSVLNALAIASYYPSGETLDVDFPLGSGTYYVLQGGGSAVTNPFHALSGDRKAVDIVKLNRFGNRADGIAPRALSAYEIFGERLHSPCQGPIDRVRAGLPDNPPGHPDTEQSEGNYVVVRCDEADIFMAHLKQGSIRVAPGEVVTAGQPLAEVGNSGNSLEPHLHISASENGREIGLRFGGRSVAINSVIRRGE
ncbi:M23 family metallopeptidase [Guyparkeria hydrothermalis]|uniref:M23 family metallopeptidase n=1 Tax=Guyparkeria TaxID=2035712 RepID=UPI001B7F7DFA|nr:M23 family metallopeptidase [Guyparkeria sp. SB14A]MCL7750151.1 M23 family metallopeptidase [Guyparkeria hydrothermalis]